MERDIAHGERFVPGRLHWIVGPVGAGKSTLALRLARRHSAVRMNLDEWMATLYRGDPRPQEVMAWYRERSERCLEQIWAVTLQMAAVGTNVILELGLIQRQAREPFLNLLDGCGLAYTVYVVDAARELRRRRVEQRNLQRGPTYAMAVPPAVFELASDLWEPLSDAERLGREVHDIDGSR